MAASLFTSFTLEWAYAKIDRRSCIQKGFVHNNSKKKYKKSSSEEKATEEHD